MCASYLRIQKRGTWKTQDKNWIQFRPKATTPNVFASQAKNKQQRMTLNINILPAPADKMLMSQNLLIHALDKLIKICVFKNIDGCEIKWLITAE